MITPVIVEEKLAAKIFDLSEEYQLYVMKLLEGLGRGWGKTIASPDPNVPEEAPLSIKNSCADQAGKTYSIFVRSKKPEESGFGILMRWYVPDDNDFTALWDIRVENSANLTII